MYPVICKIGPFTIYSYGLMIAFAFIICLYLLTKRAESVGIDSGKLSNLAFIVLIFGILGARALYVSLHFHYYIGNLKSILKLAEGGLSWFGALFIGSLAGIIYIKKSKLPIYKTLDLAIPFIALGQAIGRIGCLFNGCCYGPEADFGIYFKVHNLTLIPVQLYSSLILLGIFVILIKILDRPHKEGQVFFSYLILYSLGRFIIEFWRVEHEIIVFGLTIFQVFSIIVFLLAFWRLIARWKNLN